MPKAIRLLCGALLISISLPTWAQVNSVSPYSRLGMGEMAPINFTRALGMGGANMGMPSALNIDLSNPASYTDLRLTTFEAGMEFSFLNQSQTNPDLTINNNRSGFRFLAVGVPLTDWWASTAGLKPYSYKGYDISSERNLASDPDLAIRDNFTGTGGLNKVFWGNAFKIGESFSVGINANYLFGSLIDIRSVNFLDDSFLDTREENETRVEGFTFDYGARYQYDFSDKFVGLGLSLSQSMDLNGNFTQYRYTVGDGAALDSLTGTVDRASDYTLPNELRAGISFGKRHPQIYNPAWAINFDYESYRGSEFEDAQGLRPYRDGYRLQVGGLIIPRFTFSTLERSTGYMANVEYRLGAFFEETPMVLNGVGVQDYGITFGIGLPVSPRNLAPGEVKVSSVNLGFIYGRRGTLDQGLIQEEYYSIYLGISLSDKWFIDYKYR